MGQKAQTGRTNINRSLRYLDQTRRTQRLHATTPMRGLQGMATAALPHLQSGPCALQRQLRTPQAQHVLPQGAILAHHLQ
jgi:hypothetical protein